MNLDDLVGKVSEMSDDELAEKLKQIRANRRMRPEKKEAKPRMPKASKQPQLTPEELDELVNI